MDVNERRRQAGEDAADWWVLLNDPAASRADRERFVEWLSESAVHVSEFLHVAQVHGALDRFTEWSLVERGEAVDTTVVPLRPMPPQARSRESTKRGTPSRYSVGRIAAAVALLAAGVTWLLLFFGGQTLTTERGERREVNLADGSSVQMAPETRLRVSFDENERIIVLKEGRALFKVTRNPHRPFIVSAGNMRVRAIGTAFAVEHRAHDVLVTVSAGKVAVTSDSSPAARSGLPFAARSEEQVAAIDLSAGEQIAVSGRATAASVRKVDSKRELAWAEGRLVFQRTPLSDVVAELNRYNRIRYRVTDYVLGRRPVSAVFDAADQESFLAFVEAMAPVRITRGEEEIEIGPAGESAEQIPE
jgi:transmembrane sensor